MITEIKINLLPWREEQRELRKREFINVLVGVLVVAALIIFAVDRYYRGEINTQNARNRFLQNDISVLEGKIAEIKQLQQKRARLLARMQVIQELQGNRPIIVRVFDELARRLADRVFYTRVSMKGKDLSITGIAESNNRISSQLRNFEESKWFAKPNVTDIVADPRYGPTASRFTMSVEQSAPKKEEVK